MKNWVVLRLLDKKTDNSSIEKSQKFTINYNKSMMNKSKRHLRKNNVYNSQLSYSILDGSCDELYTTCELEILLSN